MGSDGVLMSAAYEAKERYQQGDVAEGYDRARFRGVRGALVNRLEQRLLLRAMDGIEPGARVLDLPVGTGRMARRLATAGYRVVGADISAPMLAIARDLSAQQNVGHGLLRCDGERLPFADGVFDAAVCLRLLSHLPPQARRHLLRELRRVTKRRVIAVYQPHKMALWWLAYGFLLRRPVPQYYVSHRNLLDEFAACELRMERSHALLPGLFMERAYVLVPDEV